MRLFYTLPLLLLLPFTALASEDAATAAYKQSMDKMHSAMMTAPYTGDADIDFAVQMIPHHQGAVDMAKIEMQYGKDPQMRWLARWILQGQPLEIGMMRSWLRGRQSAYVMADANTRASTIEYRKSMETMHQGMMAGYTGNTDIDFARGMIPHHQAAVDMAATLLHHGTNPDMRSLASGIFTGQQGEIAIMRRWLANQTSK